MKRRDARRGGPAAAAEAKEPSPASAAPHARRVSPWRSRPYRLLLVLWLVANVSQSMHEAASAWLMASLGASALIVALLQSASSLPTFLLALPSGALTDLVDRRRILAKIDYLARIEAARIKVNVAFSSPEIKRLFLRFFDSAQLNMHFVSVMARTRLPREIVERVEQDIADQLEAQIKDLNTAIDGAETLFRNHGITSQAEYDAQPMNLIVRVVSRYGRRYLELLMKVDQVMPMLETLAIHDVITPRELDVRKGSFKSAVKGVAYSLRRLANGLRKRMNAPPPAEATESRTTGASPGAVDGPLPADGDAATRSDGGAQPTALAAVETQV